MKNQIFAFIFGLILFNVSFAQTGANYKQQFSKTEGIQYCSNYTKLSSVDQNYKHAANAQSVYSPESVSTVNCQHNPCFNGKISASGNYKDQFHANTAKLARDHCIKSNASCCN